MIRLGPKGGASGMGFLLGKVTAAFTVLRQGDEYKRLREYNRERNARRGLAATSGLFLGLPQGKKRKKSQVRLCPLAVRSPCANKKSMN